MGENTSVENTSVESISVENTLKTVESTMNRVESTLKTVENTLKAVESTLKRVESTLKRQQPLFRRDSGGVLNVVSLCGRIVPDGKDSVTIGVDSSSTIFIRHYWLLTHLDPNWHLIRPKSNQKQESQPNWLTNKPYK